MESTGALSSFAAFFSHLAAHPGIVIALALEIGLALAMILLSLRAETPSAPPLEARSGALAPSAHTVEPAERAQPATRAPAAAPTASPPPRAVGALAPEITPPAVAPSPPPLAPAPPPRSAEPAPVPPAAAAPPPAPAAIEPEPAIRDAPVGAPLVTPAAPRPARLRDRLRRTSEALVGRLEGLLGGRRLDAATLDEMEALLFSADLGVQTAESLLERVRKQAAGADVAGVRAVLRAAILEKLARVEPPAGAGLALVARPHVVLVLGVNGSGKTTTIGKLAARHVAAGRRVVLGAGDTFRAAAIEQLQVWGERAGAEVIAGKPGGDPSAVAFDTLKAATARGADVAIVDTAGRLQTKVQLVEELKKIVRVIEREVPGAPHESLLVLDANTGQNAISQARVFVEAGRVTGLVLTKLDGTAKGGVIVGLADELGIPVKYVGVGEGVEDLRDFVAAELVDALFDGAAGDA